MVKLWSWVKMETSVGTFVYINFNMSKLKDFLFTDLVLAMV